MALRRFLALSLFLLLTILTAGLIGCASSPSAQPSAEIRIGVITQFTGEASENVWPYTTNGANLLADQVNADGGVRVGSQRLPVKLVFADDGDNPEGGTNAALKLINQDKVVALVGTTTSRVSIPVAAIAEQTRIPFVAHVSTNPTTTEGKRFVFRAIFLDPFQGKVLARFTHKNLKAQRAAALYDIADVYCQTLAESFKQEFEALGGQMVAMESYTTDNPAWQEQLERIQQLKPDVLLLPNYNRDASRQALQARELGITATLLGGDSWAYAPADKRPAYEGGFFATGYAIDFPSEVNKAFVQSYRAAYKQEPTSEAALIYDSLGMILTAIERQGTPGPVAIRDGLASIREYAGVTGTMHFAGTGDPIKSVVVMQVKDAEFVSYDEVKP